MEEEVSELLPGDLLVVQNPGWFSRLIAIFTISKFTHVACYVGLIDGKPTVVEARPTGICRTSLYEFDSIKKVETHLPLTDNQRAIAVAYWLSEEGSGYGFLDIAAMALTRIKIRPKFLVKKAQNDNRVVCSQLAANGYHKAGYEMFNPAVDPWFVAPADIAQAWFDYLDARA